MPDPMAALPAEVLIQVAERLERADVAAAQLVSRDWAEAWAATVLALAPGAMSAPPAPGYLRLAQRFPQLQARLGGFKGFSVRLAGAQCPCRPCLPTCTSLPTRMRPLSYQIAHTLSRGMQ